jgi:hypothetical protein
MKTHCKHEHQFTPENTFHNKKGHRVCKICYAASIKRAMVWNREHKDRRKSQSGRSPESRRLYMYGLTPEGYEEMYNTQGGLCALGCGRPIQCVDHCHDTEVVRELLCKRCNSAIGFMSDDPALMIRAAEYVVRHRASGRIDALSEKNIYLSC